MIKKLKKSRSTWDIDGVPSYNVYAEYYDNNTVRVTVEKLGSHHYVNFLKRIKYFGLIEYRTKKMRHSVIKRMIQDMNLPNKH